MSLYFVTFITDASIKRILLYGFNNAGVSFNYGYFWRFFFFSIRISMELLECIGWCVGSALSVVCSDSGKSIELLCVGSALSIVCGMWWFKNAVFLIIYGERFFCQELRCCSKCSLLY